MKRFLIALFICLVPFVAKATTPLLIVQTDATGMIPSSQVENKTEDYVGEYDVTMTDKIISNVVGAVADFFTDNRFFGERIDEKLRDYVDEADYNYMMKHGSHFYLGETGNASFESGGNIININPSYLDSSSEVAIKSTIHHEVQHLKDAITFEEKTNIDTFYIGTQLFPYFDRMTQQMFHAITEAQAYSSEPVFVYEKMKNFEQILEKRYGNIDNAIAGASGDYENILEEYKKYKEYYDSMSKKNIWYDFDKAIKNGKTVEQAQHDAMLAALDWQYVDAPLYMDTFSKSKVGTKHFSLSELISIMGNDVTLRDFYAAERFWVHLCGYLDTKDTDECEAAQRRFMIKNCSSAICNSINSFHSRYKIKTPNPYSEDFKADELFAKVENLFEKDKICGRGRRILTTQALRDAYDDDTKNYYRRCCSFDWDFKWFCETFSSDSLCE